MQRRSTIQLAMLVVGLVVWGYGQRVEDPTLRLVGIAFFALATLLRFFKRSDTRRMADDEAEPGEDDSQY